MIGDHGESRCVRLVQRNVRHDKKWLDEYCFNGGRGCVRKKRFEGEGYVSPDYVLPDGTIDPRLKEWVEGR